MNRFGSSTFSEKNMSDDDVFAARLQLLVIMSKAFLEGCDAGEYQKKAIVENARTLFYASLFMGQKKNTPETDLSENDNTEIQEEAFFHHKIRQLSVAGIAFAEGRLIEENKKKELQDNIDYISKKITFESQIDTIAFFKSG